LVRGLNPYRRIDVPRLLDRLHIEARLKPDGRAFTASCPSPDHADKSPSWFIRNIPGEQYHAAHKCQGCGFGGGPRALVEAVLGLDGDDAREWLSDLAAPPPMPTEVELDIRAPTRTKRFALPKCVKMDVDFAEWPEPHRVYLTTRNLGAAEVVRWRLGFVPVRASHRLQARIVVPIRDALGRVCSYTARSVIGDTIRYKEPKDDENDERCIFGEEHWGDRQVLIVVEGPFDAMAVDALVGSSYAVAALRGSSPHPTTLNKLVKFARVIVMTDPDKAGKKAKAIVTACGRHSEIKPIKLPPESDPAKLYETEEGRAFLGARILRAAA
jgi:DNA primase